MAVGIDHRSHGHALAGDFHQRLGQRGVLADFGHRIAGAHDVEHMGQQLAAERAARVRAGEVFLAEAARVQHRHRQRIAQRQRGGGACRWRQVERAGFLFHARVQVRVSQLG
ncbi:hypothetical protein D9M68_900880 [compost metagenome]